MKSALRPHARAPGPASAKIGATIDAVMLIEAMQA
jgi:hypothetical protein